MAKTTRSLWYSVWTVSLLMALSILAVMMVNLPTAACAKPTADKTNVRSRCTLRGVQIASLGNASHEAIVGRRDGLSGGSVRWTASAGCLNSTLRRVVGAVAATFVP
jgi:hypothetical protein